MKNIRYIITTVLLGSIMFGCSIGLFFVPKDSYSDSERRELAKFPEIKLDEVLSTEFMSDFEDFTLDNFPLRDSLRALKSITEFYVFGKKDNNNIYLADGYASKLDYPLNDAMIAHAVSRIDFIYKTYLKDKADGIYLSVVPDKNVFLAEENGYPHADYDKMIADLREGTEFAEYIDIFGELSIEDYYRTDTHWKQENITDVAEKLLTSMGAESGKSEYKVNTLDNPFYGVYYGQSALPLKPDTINYLTSDILDGCTVKIAHPQSGMPMNSTMYNMDRAYGKDPYEMFLSGATPVVVIENPNAATDKELVIFRDSFGSSIAPLMAEGYAKVTLVDIRYLNSGMIGTILPMYGVSFEGADVLFLYSTLILNTANILN